MSRTKLLWIPATLVATFALAAFGAQLRHAHAPARGGATCGGRVLSVDLDGDRRPEQIRLVRVGDDAWVDVWSGAAMRSSTRVGAWHDDAELEALDVNGDGRLDLVRRWNKGAERYAQVWLADGLAFSEGWIGVTSHTCVAQR